MADQHFDDAVGDAVQQKARAQLRHQTGVGSETLTQVLPMVAPVNSPVRALTHDSMPSKMVWRCTSRPSASHWRSDAKASSKRPHWSSELKPCMSAVLASRLT